MTSLADVAGKATPRSRLLWVALAVSLTLNIFFIAGLVWSQVSPPPFPTPAERLAQTEKELNLSGDQRDAFQRFVTEVRERTRHLRETNKPILDRVWDELAKPQPDQDVIARLVDEATENRRVYQKDMSAVLAQFLAALSPEQRNQFIDLAKRPRDQRGAHLGHLIIP